MKKTLLITAYALAFIASKAQVVTDTVSLGSGYSNQKWYSLQNDEQGSAPKDNWDIAFDVGGMGTSILTNSIMGTMLWTYPLADTSGWTAIDTSGINLWTANFNSDTTWSIGAFDKGANASNSNDVGWGLYNSITHTITGDSLFVIKLSNGEFKKLRIINLSGGGYNFQYADLNGDNLQTQFLPKSSFTGKNFGYFSLQTNTALNREPVESANWDLLFTQYTAFVPSPYTVSGVLSNKGVKVAQVDNVSNPSTYNNWSTHTFETPINEIGYDWKAFSSTWQLVQDTVYFVQSKQGEVWKLQFTGFGGGSTGNFIFTKEKLSSVGFTEINTNSSVSISLYPNPSNNESVTLLYNLEKGVSKVEYSLYDLFGRKIQSENLNSNSGLYSHLINTTELESGLYIVSVTVGDRAVQQRLIIK